MKSFLLKMIVLFPLWIINNNAYAGKIILKTELWEFICEVEVAVGPDSPVFIEEILEFPGVKIDGEYIDGIVFEGEDRLCYRRSAIVDDCNSPLNDWVCYTNSRDEPQIIPVY